MAPRPSTLKALGAVCGNVCAFPHCIAPIYDTRYNVLVGEVCHIEAKSEDGPRFNKNQTDEERHDFDNLVFMCSAHHTVIDDKSRLDEFTVEVLKQMKRDHEERSSNTILTEDVLERLVRKVRDLQAPSKVLPKLAPVIEALMTRAGNDVGIDIYDFRIKLRNDGPSTVREYRIEVEIPRAYATSNSHYPAEKKEHNRGDVRLWRFTEEGHPGFVLYPAETSDYLILLDYTVSMDQYVQITADPKIKVLVYSGDDLISSTEYLIACFLNKDRCNMLWAPGKERPAVLSECQE
ncbi:MAG: hypothetical protein QOG23_217 [Blastocatellia bacterium]|jgi:hypothetical protein|nr:hypothetical protein [Blastocatellia bacterium]